MFFKTKSKYDYLIVGLGNPGDKYAATRHNVGFRVIEILADSLGVRLEKNKFQSYYCDATVGDKKVLLQKPITFMNNSGTAVSEIISFYKLSPERIIVISDDVSMDVGRLRIRQNGSHGGHNGLKDIIELCGTDNIIRIKLGVGQKPHPDYDLANWVLGKPSKEDAEALADIEKTASDAVKYIVSNGVAEAMNKFNR